MNNAKYRYLGHAAATAVAAGLIGLTRAADHQPKQQIYQLTNVVSAHFNFSASDWQTMMPKGGGDFFGGRGPRIFGPGMILANPVMRLADSNHDENMSRAEFASLSEKWFKDWDKKQSGKLSEEELRDGLNTVLRDAGPGGPGRPGGPGPGRPGLNLQGQEGKRNGLASAAGIEFQYVHANLTLDGKNLSNVAVRYKGNGTWMESRNTDKHSMKVDLNEFVKKQKFAGRSKLNFHNCVTDASYLNEVLSYWLFREAKVPAPKTAFARVYLTVAGQEQDKYLGLYSMVENVDTAFLEENFGTKKGAIFKPVTPAPFTYLGADWAKYNQTYDAKTDLSDSEKQRVIEFCRLVSSADDAEFAANFGEYLDLDNFARFMAITVWLSNMDSILGPGQNYYVFLHPKTHRLNFIPWDLDHSFGQFPLMGSQMEREKLSLQKPWQGENVFLERVYKDGAFQKLYRSYLTEFNRTICRPEHIAAEMDKVAAAIRPAVKEESEEKLARFDKIAAGEDVPPRFFGRDMPVQPRREQRGEEKGEQPGPRFGPPGMMQPMKSIKGFSTARNEAVAEQLSGKSEGETLGFGPGGGRRGPGGPGRGGPGGPGGPGGFGPGMFLGGAFHAQLDTDHSGDVSHDEFTNGLARWFDSWDSGKAGKLTEEQLRDGLNETFRPRGFPFGGPPNNRRDPDR